MGSVGLYPGDYVFNGQGYDCNASGLYRFWDGSSSVIHSRLVYANDIYGYMSAFAWHQIHGSEDETTNYQAAATAGMTHKWRMRCGPISGLVNWFMGLWSLQSRVVSLLTLGPKNGEDDGHVAIEVFDGGKWKLWDIDNGVYFTQNGVHLSAAEIIAAGILNCQRVAIDGDSRNAASLAAPTGLCMGSYGDMFLRTPADFDAWFARIYQSWSVA